MRKKAFTLIEMLIVVSVIGLILPVLFSITFAIFREQALVYQITEVKREGDNVISFLDNKIRQGQLRLSSVNNLSNTNTELCTKNTFYAESTDGQGFYFIPDESPFTKYFRVYLSSNQLKFESNENGSPALVSDLTSSNVTVSNFLIDCRPSSLEFGAPIVGISFKVTHSKRLSPSTPPLSLYFSTQYKLRSR